MTIKLTETKLCVFLLALLVFLDMEPFFVWSSVSPLGYTCYTGVILIATCFMAYRIFTKKRIVLSAASERIDDRKRISLFLVLASSLIVLFFFYKVFLSGVVTVTQQPFNMAMLCIHIGLMLFVLQDNITLQQVFLVTKKIFALSLIPAIIVFLLMQIGIVLPHSALVADAGKVAMGESYDLYMGLATMIRTSGVLLNRLCGIYREPGFVGTVGALYFFGDEITLKKWENKVIILAGICTFSLAFVLLMFLGLILRAAGNIQKRSRFITSVALILAVVLGYFIFMSLSLDPGSMFGELQARLEFTDEGLAGDNRFGSSELAVKAYDQFLNSDLKTRLFGYGVDRRTMPGTQISIWQHVHSYKEFVFGFGFIGLVLMIAAIVLIYFVKFKKVPSSSRWHLLVLLAVFLISIYQRYEVMNFHYYCVLFGGAANLALTEHKRLTVSDEACSVSKNE